MTLSKIVKKFKLGEEIPSDAKFLYNKIEKENYKTSNYTWCCCPDLLNCNCATWDTVMYSYYEVFNTKRGEE